MAGAMYKSTDNLEPITRDICSKQLSAIGLNGFELDVAVNMYWHCVAAEPEAGLLDKKCSIEEGLAAYRDRTCRHPLPPFMDKTPCVSLASLHYVRISIDRNLNFICGKYC
jgi:hypothetical protein